MEKQLCLQHMQIIQSVCLEKECNKQYYCCCECLLETHQNHELMNANDFQDLEKNLKDLSVQLFQDIEYTLSVVSERFTNYKSLVDNYMAKQNQINKREFQLIHQSITQRLLKLRHLVLKKDFNDVQLKLLWSEEEIHALSEYLETIENKEFISKLAQWQEKLREQHNQIISSLQFEIETDLCQIGPLEQQDQQYYGQHLKGIFQGRGILISNSQVQDGLFKNGQFVYGLWLTENANGEVVEKEGLMDESIQRQMKSLIVQANYLKTLKDYDNIKSANHKRFDWDEEEQQIIQQFFESNNPLLIKSYHSQLKYAQIPEEYYYLQFNRTKNIIQINEQTGYLGGLNEEGKMQGRGILFESNVGIKDGIWEDGEFLWGVWLYQYNNKIFTHFGILTEEKLQQFEEFKQAQEQQEKIEQDEMSKENHEKKLRFFKKMYIIMDSMLSGRISTILGYVHFPKLKEYYLKNKLDKDIDVPEEYLQIDQEPEIIRNSKQLYVGFLNADKNPNMIGFYCSNNLLAGGFWINGILKWGYYNKLGDEGNVIIEQNEISEEYQEQIQILNESK